MKKVLFLLSAVAALLFVGCSKDDGIKLTKSEITLHFGEEYQIEAETDANLTFTSENQYHATVSEAGLVTALFVGETNIIVSDGSSSAILKVIVAPKSNLYEEPYLEWGSSTANVTKHCGTPDSTESDALIYMYPSETVDMLTYLFENDKLNSVGVFVKSRHASELAKYLAERYLPVTNTQQAGYVFVNGLNPESVTMLIAMKQSGNYFIVMYVPYTDNARSEQMTQDIFDRLSVKVYNK